MKTIDLIGQASLIFTAKVRAENTEQAINRAKDNFGMLCNTHPIKDACIINWEVPMKPDVEIIGQRLRPSGNDYRADIVLKKFKDEDTKEHITMIYDKDDDSLLIDKGGDSFWFTRENWEKIVQMGTLLINSAK